MLLSVDNMGADWSLLVLATSASCVASFLVGWDALTTLAQTGYLSLRLLKHATPFQT